MSAVAAATAARPNAVASSLTSTSDRRQHSSMEDAESNVATPFRQLAVAVWTDRRSARMYGDAAQKGEIKEI
jgi:hypothetical protein